MADRPEGPQTPPVTARVTDRADLDLAAGHERLRDPLPDGRPEAPYVTARVTAWRPCERCGRAFVAGRADQRHCSAACRQAAYRARRALVGHDPAARAPRAATIYECPQCLERLLGEQRCEDCNRFCRRVGPGGPCPHCDEPVALADLIEPGSV